MSKPIYKYKFIYNYHFSLLFVPKIMFNHIFRYIQGHILLMAFQNSVDF